MWTAAGVSAPGAQPFLDTFVPKDVFTWERHGLVVGAERFRTNEATIDRVQLGIDEGLHGS
jgi:hypothetical protein